MTLDDLAQAILERLRDIVPITVDRDGTRFLVGAGTRLQLDLPGYGRSVPIEAVDEADLLDGVYSILSHVRTRSPKTPAYPGRCGPGNR
jgi:hypothetical protein